MTFATFGSPVHPGGILREIIIPASNMATAAFADRLGIQAADLEPVVAERAPVTAELALRLGRLLEAGGAEHWLRLQAMHDLAVEARRLGEALDRIQPLGPDEATDLDDAA